MSYLKWTFYATGPDFSNGYVFHLSSERTGLSPWKIAGISLGTLFSLCVIVFIGYKCCRQNNRDPHVAVVHSLTNDVGTEQEQDTTL